VCVAQWISMCRHGTPQDNMGYRSIELRYSTQSVHSHNHAVAMKTLHMH
jgi:hypothetical protein